MHVADHEGNVATVHAPDELIARLRSVRKGPYGAFILCHGTAQAWDDQAQSSLWVHINDDVAYLWFVVNSRGRHPGFQPVGMSPAGCPGRVHFMQTDGFEEAGITIDRDWLVSVDLAYKAAAEFLKEPVLPTSISWFEL